MIAEAPFGETRNIDMEAMVEQSTASRSIMCDTNIATVKKLVIK